MTGCWRLINRPPPGIYAKFNTYVPRTILFGLKPRRVPERSAKLRWVDFQRSLLERQVKLAEQMRFKLSQEYPEVVIYLHMEYVVRR